ncbi:hypothetical protein [Apilactobacillus xinyiensis]|uniref:hypothetical protein n=1 Tax=Apilactobacillus xinyiensis TaxID=2841032 RepID=UPI001C7D7AA2|nr:hypothetical protein [Apilactobacillus xinyiensis]
MDLQELNNHFKVKSLDDLHKQVLKDYEYTRLASLLDFMFSQSGKYTEEDVMNDTKKYVVTIGVTLDLPMCYIKRKDDYSIASINLFTNASEDCLFDKEELNKLYSYIEKTHGKNFANVAKTATITLEDYKNRFFN